MVNWNDLIAAEKSVEGKFILEECKALEEQLIKLQEQTRQFEAGSGYMLVDRELFEMRKSLKEKVKLLKNVYNYRKR
jgi:hypothetical protein